MRDFSEYEKKIIQEIVKTDIQKSNVLDVISNITLIDRGIHLKEKEIELVYFKSDQNALNEFFETLSLIKYLERNDLIFIHSNYDFPNEGNYISKNLDQETITKKGSELISQPIPTNIYDIISNFRKSYLVIGTELKKLVENSFKTNEQIHHETELKESRKQTRISTNSFYIALVALLFSLLAPFIFNSKFDENQINSIKKELNNNSTNEIQELEKIRGDLKIISDSIRIKAQTPNNVYKK
ncbi:hypothetical protein ACJOV8_000400 [Formosa sp. 3Alg 14/1]|uniref:hypothetical protein n=1 Tax=Formosa sp. 3Alg 14/1 TaxID=3382190 RepID=UPI0039BDD6F1